jgi:uncharacterized membrane protein
MEYCGSCGVLFDGTEETTRSLLGSPSSSSRTFDWDERGRVSQLLYLGAGLIALSGLLSAYAIASLHGERMPPSFTDYSGVFIVVGIAFVLVGFARQARRMRE